ncbi:hypothetical protein pEaSNUABM54_00153 [Erwinia phage pEa_SNUABM_54]|nr:hypothetical protein pEaSNUABM54_00153 [Erwinia phage pEa_SNUABM_54]
MKLVISTLVALLTMFAVLPATASISTDSPYYQDWSKHRAVIVKASVRANTDPGNMAAVAFIESKFKGNIRRGLFQFDQPTWRAMLKESGAKYGLSQRTKMSNPMANALMAAELWKKNRAFLTAKLGRPVADSEVYMAHFLGNGGALAMLKAKPGRLARDVAPMQAKYNRSLFYSKGKGLTVSQFRVAMAAKLDAPKRTFGSEARARALMNHDYAYNR